MTAPHPNLAALQARRDRTGKPVQALCYAPFAQLSFDPTGAVSVCCLSRFQPIGNVADASLGEIWRGEGMRVVREALQRDEWPATCATCRWELESGNVERHPLLDFDDVPLAPGLQWPTRLEFALSNQCNLACIHCRPGLSSTIERQQGLPPSPRVYGERFFAELAAFLPHATHLSFLGGEPFLQDECHRIWAMLVEQGLRPGVFVTTNGTVWNPRVERILEQLPMHLAVSLDGVTPRTIRAVRVHAQPDAVRRNIDRFRDYALRQRGGTVPADGHLISLNFALMRRNWREAGDFFLLAEELACRIWATPVLSPRQRSLFTLPAHAQRAVADALQRQSERVLPQLRRNAGVWTGLVAMVESEAQKAAQREVDAALAERHRAMPDAWDAMRRGAEEEAYHHAAQTRPDDPNYLASLLLRASLLTGHGHLGLAEQVVDEASRLAPDDHEVLLRRGWLRHRQQRLPEGLADAARLAQRLAEQPVDKPWVTRGVHSLRANLLASAGDHDGARAAIDALLAIDPQNADAQAFRARLPRP